MQEIFNLPDVGEGLTEAEIVSWKVKPGDTVTVNQILVEIETAKSLVELPSPHAGKIGELLAPEGETVEVGAPIISFAGTDSVADGATTPGDGAAAAAAPAGDRGTTAENSGKTAGQAGKHGEDDDGSGATLVGYGSRPASSARRARHQPSAAASTPAVPVPEPPTAPAPTATAPEPTAAIVPEPTPSAEHTVTDISAARVLAKPPVRKLARDKGLDLASITPTGPRGEVTRDDVLGAAAGAQTSEAVPTGSGSAGPAAEAGAGALGIGLAAAAGERETRIPVKSVRKMTAQAMVRSAFTAPHVSLFLDVDATRTMDFVRKLKTSKALGEVRVSPLLLVAKAVIWAVGRNPMVNSTFADDEITVKNYVNLGIAAATPRGLIVPNIKDADRLSLGGLAQGISDLTELARSGKTPPADQAGGTITITNVGVFGVDTGTPIINPGESAIVAFGSIRKKPWVVDGEVVARDVTTLGISADHRVIDGDVASRFVADIGAALEEPAILLTGG
ncbi:dihydrolipoamide acetyltransferase family protein [Saxibacter everestensis]|uniref:Dihydrolipoamide acetyltransferase component of pyruvate dehydrogenase complex n=1 Tax=Saxibacter everestensis TaxID=2909229 RepID=A0ABY8QSJ9_9MICO|nr:dihydrolipoamide acetyltransferase family protein [Brevibacteriaceae bacterium ZFBP1038]